MMNLDTIMLSMFIGGILSLIFIFLYRSKPKGMTFSEYTKIKPFNMFQKKYISRFQVAFLIVAAMSGLSLFFTNPKHICGDVISESIVNYGSKEKPNKYARIVLKGNDNNIYKEEIKLYIYESHKGNIYIERIGNYTIFFTALLVFNFLIFVILFFFRDDLD